MPPKLASLSGLSVHQARTRISGMVHRTPVITSPFLSRILQSSLLRLQVDLQSRNVELFFKCENFQKGGSFKFRGALHCLTRLSDAELSGGLVTYSTGNHARALAIAAKLLAEERQLLIPVSVVMSRDSPTSKIESLGRLGANIIMTGNRPEDRAAKAAEIQRETGAKLIPPSDNPDIASGQGTTVLEFDEQVQELCGEGLDAVIMPSGGGGLLTGAALVGAELGLRVFGAEPTAGGPQLAQGRASGVRVETISTATVADGLRVPVGPDYFELLRRPDYVDDVYAATEDQICAALCLVLAELKLVVEPSAAVALAAVLHCPRFHKCLAGDASLRRIGVVLTGGNVPLATLLQIVNSHGKATLQ
ncbi:putative NRPS-like protein biosynthetic cluster [Pestalotiopsis sp. IQ-011]